MLGTLKNTLNARQWLLAGGATRSQSHLINGDFESNKENVAQPEADWQTKGAPVGWSTWSRRGLGRFNRVSGANAKSHGISIDAPESGETATLLQTISVKPDEGYIALASVKLKDPGQNAAIKLNIRFRTEKGQSINTFVIPRAEPGWQQLVLPFTPPKGTTSLIVMLSADASSAVFDDVAIHKLP